TISTFSRASTVSGSRRSTSSTSRTRRSRRTTSISRRGGVPGSSTTSSPTHIGSRPSPPAPLPSISWGPPAGRGARAPAAPAPTLPGLARCYRHLDLQLVGADIPHLLFHYARWKFRDARFVTMVPIGPEDDAPLQGSFDSILCLETFEHLPRPLAIAKHLHGA